MQDDRMERMKNIHASGKRKRAIARATLSQGNGLVRVNHIPVDLAEPKLSRLKLREPLILAGDMSNKVNIDVDVFLRREGKNDVVRGILRYRTPN